MNIGGILGCTSNYGIINIIENCVNGGKIISNEASYCIGSIVGYVDSDSTTIKHCYWSNDVGYNKAYGNGSPMHTESSSFIPVTFKLNEAVSIGNYTGTSLLDALNAFADRYYITFMITPIGFSTKTTMKSPLQ